MLTQPDVRLSVTRRGFLQAMGLAFACGLRPITSAFTTITDDFAWLMRWCCFGGRLRFAAAG